jgi:hypothetical protein
MRPWTPDEDAILREGYQTQQAHVLARRLDRTILAIRTRAYKLGLTRSGDAHKAAKARYKRSLWLPGNANSQHRP